MLIYCLIILILLLVFSIVFYIPNKLRKNKQEMNSRFDDLNSKLDRIHNTVKNK